MVVNPSTKKYFSMSQFYAQRKQAKERTRARSLRSLVREKKNNLPGMSLKHVVGWK